MITPPSLPPEEPQTPSGFSATGGVLDPAALPPPLPPVSGVSPLPPPLPGRIVVTKGKGAVPREAATGEPASPVRAAHDDKAASEEPPPPPLVAPARPDAAPPPVVDSERRPPDNPFPPAANPAVKKAPALAMWICMVLAWIFLGSAKPFTILLGAPLDLAAFVLAIVCIVRERVGQGVIGIIGSVVVAGGIYAIAFFRMAFGALGS